MQQIKSWGEHFNWTCRFCGDSDFDKDEEWFVGHKWDCEEREALYDSMEEEE